MFPSRLMRGAAALLTFLTLAVSSAAAQPAPRDWQAWVFSPATGVVQQVDPTGAVAGSLWLPLAQAFNAYDAHVNVSTDGRYVAYTAYDSTIESSSRQLFLYDAQSDTIRYAHDLSGVQAVGFSVTASAQAFDSTGGQYAFGLASAEGWQVVAVDLVPGTVRATLDQAAFAQQHDAAPGLLPVVMRYEGAQVVFNLVQGTSVDAVYAGGYRWDIVSGQITPDGSYGFFTSPVDALPAAGEIVTAAVDADRESAGAGVPNVVRVIVPGGEPLVVAHSPAEPLRQALFVQDGAQVLLSGQRDGQPLLRVLNRDGSTAGELLGTLDTLHGTPNGFIGTFDTGGGVALALVDTTGPDFAIQTLWTTGDTAARLVHVQAFGPPPTDFPAWQPLAD